MRRIHFAGFTGGVIYENKHKNKTLHTSTTSAMVSKVSKRLSNTNTTKDSIKDPVETSQKTRPEILNSG